MENDHGTFGALIELYHEQTDGFRDIQNSVNGAYGGSDETGYDRTDYMVKLSFEPTWERRNHFELKIFANVTNIFEEEYISSRIPLGPRAGAPRLFSAGFNYRF